MHPADQPRVSVLIPAFDAAGTFPACLRSVARQTLPSWECVVVDDGSTDATRAIAHEFARADPRFRVIPMGRVGLVRALNAGLRECRGRFLARMDADDLMHGERLERQATLLDREPRLAGVGCHVRIFPRRDLDLGYRAYEAWLNSIDSPAAVRREAFVECPVAHPSLMLRRERIPEEGYRDRGWPEDYDLILRLLGAGCEIGVLAERRLSWRNGPGRLSRTDPRYAIESFCACKASFLAKSFLAGADRYVLWGYGSAGRGLRRALAAEGKSPATIVEMHPGRLGNRIHGAPVVRPEELARLPRLPLVVAVAGSGPRNEIRAALAELDYRETTDFVCAA